MIRIGILLLGMASLAASGILDRQRFGLHSLQGMGVNRGGVQGLDVNQNVLSHEDLLKQKFILDILRQIQLPLQDPELLQLGQIDINNADLLKRPLDQDMLFVSDLIRKNQILTKNEVCNMSNEQHLRQMVGLYRLFLNARDFLSLQRIIVHIRDIVNTELFVNALILALSERSDTKMLIIPALYEILPQLYQDQDLIEEIRNVGDQYLLTDRNVGISSIRPNLLDVIQMGRQNRLLNSRLSQTGGIMNILNRSELWMPWRDLHQQLALRKLAGLKTMLQDKQQLDKLVITQPIKGLQDKPVGLFTEDLGLKSYFNILIDELIVKQGLRQPVQNIGINQEQERSILTQRRYDNDRPIDRDEYEIRDRDVLEQRSDLSYGSGQNSDRLLYVGRRLRNKMENENLERGMGLNQNEYLSNRNVIGLRRDELFDQRRLEDGNVRSIEDDRNVYDTYDRDVSSLRRDDIVGESLEESRLNNRLPIVRPEGRVQLTRDYNLLDRDTLLTQRMDDNVSLNDNRLLFSGRRRKNLSAIPITNSIERRNIFDDSTISGGRRVSNDDHKDRKQGRDDRQRDRKSERDERKYEEDDSYYNRRQNPYTKVNEDDDVLRRQSFGYQDRRQDISGINRDFRTKDSSQDFINKRYDMNDELERSLYYRNRYGQGGQGFQQRNSYVGRDRDNFMSTIRRDNLDERQRIGDDDRDNFKSTIRRDNLDERLRIGDDDFIRSKQDDSKYRYKYRENNIDLQTELPTTSINDERLLHINRRRLQEIDEGRKVGNMEEGDRKYVDRDEDDRMRGGRIGNSREEGDRRYVDRDDDRMSSGRIGNSQLEGDRKYVDRDDDRMRGGRMGNNQQEGDRRYVDRDDDSMHTGNRYGNNQEEGDRKYVDRDDDSARGRNAYNRQDRLTERKESDNFQRYRRSLDDLSYDQENTINGKLLLHNLQQLAARINIERISLGLPLQTDDISGIQENERFSMNDISQHLSINRSPTPLIQQKINDITQRLEVNLKQQIQRISSLSYEEQINEIGLVLARQILDLGLLNVFSEVLNLEQQPQDGHLSNILENPLNQLLLCRIMLVVDNCIKDLDIDREILLKGVTINNVKLDRLQTYLEYADVDLVNLLGSQPIQMDRKNMKLVVGRIPRLNHKSFNINLDVTSDRLQHVVVRTFLGPKIDSSDNVVSLLKQRQNFILLDINSVELKAGRNMIKLKSNDIKWTSRDTTSYSEIYERVMRALDGDIVLTKDLLVGQNNLLPHRLLIPRGRIDGLPMQLFTIITPFEQSSDVLRSSVLGLDSLLVDRLPLNYPLGSDIQDINRLLSIPNVYLNEVMIYHEDHIKLPLLI